MKKYLELLQDVLNNGVAKEPVRVREGTTVTGTIGVPNAVFSHDMDDGFPLLTTKKMGLKNIAVELEGFIKGITSKKWFQERGCHIWDEWKNPTNNDEDDLGPIYGYQWRSFNKTYKNQNEDDGDWSNYADQLKNIVNTLTNKPTDRRMYCSAWNPNQMSMMALPPCHLGWGVTVYGNKLNLAWTQRSVDTGLGLPYNIASYGLLLTLLAKHANFEVGNLTGLLIDCHIYNNHIEPLKEQLKREPYSLPKIEIPDDDFDFWSWDHTQLKLHNYTSHPKISMEVTV